MPTYIFTYYFEFRLNHNLCEKTAIFGNVKERLLFYISTEKSSIFNRRRIIMQENLEVYEYILLMKKLQSRYKSSFGPFGEQRISTKYNEYDDHYIEDDFHDDYKEIT